jgi:chromosome segregation ATPase
VYEVSGQLGTVKVELSMLNSRHESEMGELTHKVTTLETHLATTRQQKKAAEETEVEVRVEAERSAIASAAQMAAVKKELMDATTHGRALSAELAALKAAAEAAAAAASRAAAALQEELKQSRAHAASLVDAAAANNTKLTAAKVHSRPAHSL